MAVALVGVKGFAEESSVVRTAVPAVAGDWKYAELGHERLAFTERPTRQPDHTANSRVKAGEMLSSVGERSAKAHGSSRKRRRCSEPLSVR